MIHRVWGHFKTITKHKYEVMKNCFRAGIFLQGCLHDLSKYSPEEFWLGVKYYQGYRSPNEAEREAYGYSKAWMHHKGRNKHHYEYWIDYNSITKQMEPVEMPLKYVIEMFCDRIAASKIYMKEQYTDDKPLAYFREGHYKKPIHTQTAQLLEELLVMLAQEGEAKTFSYIRKIKNNKSIKDK